MSDLELSVMAHSPTTASDLKPILAQFEAKHHVKVKIRVFSWETGWNELVKFALYGHGPDVSEIGSTWAGTLAATSALHAFSAREISAIGGRRAFLLPSWQSCALTGESNMWAIPWLSNVRLTFYRADHLQRVGCFEPAACRTPDLFAALLQQLAQRAESVPLTLATHATVNVLHNAAIWVWGAHGAFLTANGQQTRFNGTAARQGLAAYFQLHRYLAPSAQGLDDQASDRLFLQDRAALTISDPGLLYAVAAPETATNQPDQIRATLPPGVPFVGGSNLVIWRHTRQEKLAFELVKYLTSQPVQLAYSPHARSLPVRLEALTYPPYSTEPLYQSVVEALKVGRSYQVNRLWGMVEERLIGTLQQIWADTFTQPDTEIEALLDRHLPPLADKLNRVLASEAER